MTDTFMVLNHGSTTDDTNNANLITIISRHYKRNRPDSTYTLPGFGSGEYVKLAAGEGDLRAPGAGLLAKSTVAYAHSLMQATVHHLLEELYGGGGEGPRLQIREKYRNIRDIVFIGWSRGCITTWYQIRALEKVGFNGNFHVLNFDPCYGPTVLPHQWIYEGMHSPQLRTSWEVLMLFCGRVKGKAEGSGFVLFPPWPSNNPMTKRAFIPGEHSSAVENTNMRWGPLWKIGFSIAESFLRTILPMQLISPPELVLLTKPQHREIYARCKLKDGSSNYGGTPRPIGGLYTKYKSGTDWGKSGFFYNHYDYKYLYDDYKNLALALCRKRHDPNLLDVEWRRLLTGEPWVAASVYRWVNMIHLWQGVKAPVKKLISDGYMRQSKRELAAMVF